MCHERFFLSLSTHAFLTCAPYTTHTTVRGGTAEQENSIHTNTGGEGRKELKENCLLGLDISSEWVSFVGYSPKTTPQRDSAPPEDQQQRKQYSGVSSSSKPPSSPPLPTKGEKYGLHGIHRTHGSHEVPYLRLSYRKSLGLPRPHFLPFPRLDFRVKTNRVATVEASSLHYNRRAGNLARHLSCPIPAASKPSPLPNPPELRQDHHFPLVPRALSPTATCKASYVHPKKATKRFKHPEQNTTFSREREYPHFVLGGITRVAELQSILPTISKLEGNY
ncbi:hypothetical protein VTN00DRAFT_186 [Thermoascus crustaceus]|uniref:uncharacterized protein n=1 Tax=Thermoascus crustaceus TaxID=5088 RepID=UPI003743CE6F